MRRFSFRLLIPILLLAVFIPYSPRSSAYDELVYNNLLKSKDALQSQQADLQTAYDETQRQIDALNAKLVRIDSYLKQVSTSLKDVNTALIYAKQ
jgi:hypothetical protein